MTVTAESPRPDLLQFLVFHTVVKTDAASPSVLVGRLQTMQTIVLIIIMISLLLLVSLRVGAAVKAVALVSRPAGAVEAAQGVGAVCEQRARPVLALIQVRLLTELPSPAVVTVALQHNNSLWAFWVYLGNWSSFGYFVLKGGLFQFLLPSLEKISFMAICR